MDPNNTPQPFEIVEIDRRYFLRLAGGAVFALTTLGMVGCGGGGAGGSSGGGGKAINMTGVKGTLQFPSGFSHSMTGMTVKNGFASGPVAANLGFTVNAVDTGPSLAIATDNTGKVVFLGFIDPTSKTNVLSATSTAVALIYLTLNASSYPESSRAQILSLIGSDPATPALTNVISARVLANPIAVGQADSQIANAVVTACGAIKAKISNAKPSARVRANAAVNIPPLLTIQPSGTTQSSFDVDQATDNLGFIGTNNARLERMVYLYETGGADAQGNPLPTAPPQLIGKGVQVRGTEQLNLITGLGQLFGATPWVPVAMDEIALPLDGTNTKTTYGIVMIGPGKQLGQLANVPDPPVFTNPTYAGEVADWRLVATGLFTKTVVLWLISILLEFTGLNSHGHGTFDPTTSIQIETLVETLEDIKDPAYQNALEEFFQGNFPGAFISMMVAIFTNPTVAEEVFAAIAAFAVAIIGNSIASATLETTLEGAAEAAYQSFIGILHVVGAALVLVDAIKLESDITAANIGELWEVVVAKPGPMGLQPQNPIILAGGTLNLVANNPAGLKTPPNTTIVYDWTQDGIHSILSIGSQNDPKALETTTPTVNLVTTPSQVGSINVTVTGYFLRSGVKTEFGTATTVVKIGQPKPVNETGSIKILSYPYTDSGYARALTGAFAIVPKIANATSYQVTVTFPNGDPGFGAGPYIFHVDPNNPGFFEAGSTFYPVDQGGFYQCGLSGANSPADDVPDEIATFTARFAPDTVSIVATVAV
jgi:hypothetical protein